VLYVAFLAATYVTLVVGVVLGLFPLWSLIGLATLFFAIPTSIAVLKNAENIPQLIPSLAQNVLLNILTPVLVGIGFLI
jgi:1,4-dihydroxy-2-naphthoate octaprenyltransferase